MKCPVDGDVLKAGKAEDHTGYGCTSCKGSWLPKTYIDSIQYTKEFDPQKFFCALSKYPQEATSSRCPVNCGVLSSIADINGISYCPSCLGVWFESNALKKMLKNYQTKREGAAFTDIPTVSIGIFDLFGALFK